MTPASRTQAEQQRLDALRRYGILDTEPEQAFDDLVQLATHICDVPMAYISFLDQDREWLKAKVGLPESQWPRSRSLCAHPIRHQPTAIVPNTLSDHRYSNHPLVIGSPFIRFYACLPLLTEEGHMVGSLGLLAQHPRHLTAKQEQALTALARQILNQLELRQRTRQLTQSALGLHQAEAMHERLMLALGYGTEGIALLTKEGRFTFVNAAFASMHGYRPIDLIGQSWTKLYTPEWITKLETHFFPILKKQGQWHGDLVGQTQFGQAIWTETSLGILPERHHDEQWLIWTASNITPQKSALEEITETRARLQTVLDAATEIGIIATDPQGLITLFNFGAERMLGYRCEEVIGQCSLTHFHLPAEIDSRGRQLSERFG